MITRRWKVYGAEGHRQKESFNKSRIHDWTYSCINGDIIRIVDIKNSDVTGTNDYSIITITRNTAQECEDELWGQITDGIFENCRVGNVEEVYFEL